MEGGCQFEIQKKLCISNSLYPAQVTAFSHPTVVGSSALMVSRASDTEISHGLVASGANSLDIPREPRLPDLGRNQEVDALFIPFSCHLHIIFICLVPNAGTHLVILDVLVAMPHQTMG